MKHFKPPLSSSALCVFPSRTGGTIRVLTFSYSHQCLYHPSAGCFFGAIGEKYFNNINNNFHLIVQMEIMEHILIYHAINGLVAYCDRVS